MAAKNDAQNNKAAAEDFDSIYDEVDDESFDGQDAGISFDAGEEDDDPIEEEGKPAAANSDTGDEEEDLDEKELQRKKSWEGRLRAREEELAQKERELQEKFQPGASAPNVDTDGSGMDKAAQGEADLPPGHASMTDEELAEFEAEYPDVQRYMDTRVRRVEDQVKPVVETAQKTARDLHFETIRDEHPDFLDLAKSEDMQIFIDEAPAYARDGMRRVLSSGTAAECIELLSDYKEARGLKAERRQDGQNNQDAGQGGRKPHGRRNDNDNPDEVAVTRGGRAHIPPQRRKGSDDFDSLYDSIDDDSID